MVLTEEVGEQRNREVDLAAAQLTQLAPLASNLATTQERWMADDRALLWGNQAHWYQGGPWRSGAW